MTITIFPQFDPLLLDEELSLVFGEILETFKSK